MKYTVSSGEFKQVVDTQNPNQAALNAISLWKCKSKKPQLKKITVVTSGKKEVNFLTSALLEAVA